MQMRRCMKCMHELRAEETTCPNCGQEYGKSEAEHFALRPGTILEGKYLIGQMLGQGGFGITYIGFDLLLEQKVAIKEYFPMSTGMVSRKSGSTVVWSASMMSKTGAEKGLDIFLKEARKMAKLGSIPGVVSVRNVFIENETAYIVMDYVEGETLLSKLRREGTMDFDTCIRLLMPIMQSLAEVHKHGIIHRDISPDNIMVCRDGSLVLLDLGAAKDLELKNDDGTTQHSSQLVAKHGFSPAEQYVPGRSVNASTDVYAMAATMYFCCTGKVPPSAIERILTDTLTCQPLLTQAQFRILSMGMGIWPEQRPANMDAWIHLLYQASVLEPPKQEVPKAAEQEAPLPRAKEIRQTVPQESTVAQTAKKPVMQVSAAPVYPRAPYRPGIKWYILAAVELILLILFFPLKGFNMLLEPDDILAHFYGIEIILFYLSGAVPLLLSLSFSWMQGIPSVETHIVRTHFAAGIFLIFAKPLFEWWELSHFFLSSFSSEFGLMMDCIGGVLILFGFLLKKGVKPERLSLLAIVYTIGGIILIVMSAYF